MVAENQGQRVLDLVRWGLVPPWAKALAVGDRMINARAESLLSNAYKRPFERRRCIVPADGFYEWQAVEGRKQRQPWFIRRRDGEPIAFAGLWSIWHDRKLGDDAPRVRSCTIITTEPNDLMREIHDRMPVMIAEADWDTWLDPDNHDVEALGRLLVPAPSEELERWPVTTLVNKPVNNGPELIQPRPVEFAAMEYSEFVDALRRDWRAAPRRSGRRPRAPPAASGVSRARDRERAGVRR